MDRVGAESFFLSGAGTQKFLILTKTHPESITEDSRNRIRFVNFLHDKETFIKAILSYKIHCFSIKNKPDLELDPYDFKSRIRVL
jgi:hypothetical protein